MAQRYDANFALVHRIHVVETDKHFEVHNSEEALRRADVLTGVNSVARGTGLAAILGTVGHFALRSTPYGKWIGLAAGALSGYAWHRSDMSRLNDIRQTAFPLRVEKASLPSGTGEQETPSYEQFRSARR